MILIVEVLNLFIKLLIRHLVLFSIVLNFRQNHTTTNKCEMINLISIRRRDSNSQLLLTQPLYEAVASCVFDLKNLKNGKHLKYG